MPSSSREQRRKMSPVEEPRQYYVTWTWYFLAQCTAHELCTVYCMISPIAFRGHLTAAVSPAGVIFHMTLEKLSSPHISCGSVHRQLYRWFTLVTMGVEGNLKVMKQPVFAALTWTSLFVTNPDLLSFSRTGLTPRKGSITNPVSLLISPTTGFGTARPQRPRLPLAVHWGNDHNSIISTFVVTMHFFFWPTKKNIAGWYKDTEKIKRYNFKLNSNVLKMLKMQRVFWAVCLFHTRTLSQEAVDSLQPFSSALGAPVWRAITLPDSLHGTIRAGSRTRAPAGPLIPHSIH